MIENAQGRHKQLRRFLHQQRLLRFREAALRQWPWGSNASGVDVLDARAVAPVLVEYPIGQRARGMDEDARLLPFQPLRPEVPRKGLHQGASASGGIDGAQRPEAVVIRRLVELRDGEGEELDGGLDQLAEALLIRLHEVDPVGQGRRGLDVDASHLPVADAAGLRIERGGPLRQVVVGQHGEVRTPAQTHRDGRDRHFAKVQPGLRRSLHIFGCFLHFLLGASRKFVEETTGRPRAFSVARRAVSPASAAFSTSLWSSSVPWLSFSMWLAVAVASVSVDTGPLL